MRIFSSKSRKAVSEARSPAPAKKPKGLLCRLGWTNFLAGCLVLCLVAGLIGGYRLAVLSIAANYMGALACYTVVFAPSGTVIGVIINSSVKKSTIENTSAEGEGFKYAAAKARGFVEDEDWESPKI